MLDMGPDSLGPAVCDKSNDIGYPRFDALPVAIRRRRTLELRLLK